MTLIENGHGGRRFGAPKASSAIADRKQRFEFSQKCAEVADEILQFKLATFRNTNLPVADRDRAADWISNRAFGRVPLPVEASGDIAERIHHTYEVRWLPPDPADTSNVIEPEPD